MNYKKTISIFILTISCFFSAQCNDLINATKKNNIKLVKELLKTDIDVNGIDEHCRTALHYCAVFEFTDILDLLLAHPKININAQEEYGNTAMHCAVLENLLIPVISLALKGADWHVRNYIGRTCVQDAQLEGYTHYLSLYRFQMKKKINW